MNDNTQLIKDWLQSHKSSTLPAWLKKNKMVNDWIIDQTKDYAVKNIMERVYLVLQDIKQPICTNGNPRQFNTLDKGYRIGCIQGNKCKCIGEIRMINQKKTIFEKYGVESVNSIPGTIEKRKKTNLQKFGVEYPSQSPQVQQKLKNTLSLHTQEQRDARNILSKKTFIEKYGVTHHMKLVEQREKVAATNLERYQSVTPMQNSDIVNKMKITLSSKTELEIEKSNEKRRLTISSRYGVNTASQIAVPLEILEILQNKDKFIAAIAGRTRQEATQFLGIADHTLYLYAKEYEVSDLFVRPLTSQLEIQITDFVKSLGVTVRTNDRTIISPLELDIFIPELSIAIECCGLYWHSENSANRTRNYHSNKFKKCQEQNIKLITIFDDEWINDQDKVKQRLIHILQTQTNRIYARQCTIHECSTVEAVEFVNKHHLQKYVPSKIKYSLRYNDEIVAVMTFGLARYNRKYQYEILRFCTSKHVVGAASKLFKHFVKQFNPTSVVSYSDNRWGSGSVYTKMGFMYDSCTIGYYYTDYKHRYDRSQFQKHKLVLEGADSTMSEWQIMQSRGYDRVWDCGQTLWVYLPDNI